MELHLWRYEDHSPWIILEAGKAAADTSATITEKFYEIEVV